MSAYFSMLLPRQITPGQILSTDVPADDTYAAWSGATTYATNNIVHVASTGLRYKAVQASTNQNPVTDTTATFWSPFGAATRWRPFDGFVGRFASRTGSLFYEIEADRYADGLALFGLVGTSVRVQIWNASDVSIYDQTTRLVDRRSIRRFIDYITWTPVYNTTFIAISLPIFAGYRFRVTVSGGGSSEVRLGELIAGRVVRLGIASAEGGEVGFTDFSTVEPNEFGERDIVQRGYSRDLEARVLVQNGDEERVIEALAQRRAQPTVFFIGEGQSRRGTTVLGIPRQPRIPYRAEGFSLAAIRIEGVL